MLFCAKRWKMKDIIFYGIVFLILYLSYVLFVIIRKKKLAQFRYNTYVRYLENVYHLDMNTISIKLLAHIIALANAIIITTTLWAIGITNNLLLKMLLAFAILIPFQLLVYHIIGKTMQIKHKRKED